MDHISDCHSEKGSPRSMFLSIYVSTSSSGHELWEGTERMRLCIKPKGNNPASGQVFRGGKVQYAMFELLSGYLFSFLILVIQFFVSFGMLNKCNSMNEYCWKESVIQLSMIIGLSSHG